MYNLALHREFSYWSEPLLTRFVWTYGLFGDYSVYSVILIDGSAARTRYQLSFKKILQHTLQDFYDPGNNQVFNIIAQLSYLAYRKNMFVCFCRYYFKNTSHCHCRTDETWFDTAVGFKKIVWGTFTFYLSRFIYSLYYDYRTIFSLPKDEHILFQKVICCLRYNVRKVNNILFLKVYCCLR